MLCNVFVSAGKYETQCQLCRIVTVIDCFRVFILKIFGGFIDIFILLQTQTVQFNWSGWLRGPAGGCICLPPQYFSSGWHSCLQWDVWVPSAGWSNWGCGNFPLISACGPLGWLLFRPIVLDQNTSNLRIHLKHFLFLY